MRYKVCPDYLSTGLMHNGYYSEDRFYYLHEEKINDLISEDTKYLLELCQQIFDQVEPLDEYPDYKFPHFICKKQYEILCKLVAERIESETGVATTAEFYWETDK